MAQLHMQVMTLHRSHSQRLGPTAGLFATVCRSALRLALLLDPQTGLDRTCSRAGDPWRNSPASAPSKRRRMLSTV